MITHIDLNDQDITIIPPIERVAYVDVETPYASSYPDDDEAYEQEELPPEDYNFEGCPTCGEDLCPYPEGCGLVEEDGTPDVEGTPEVEDE
jgi:hypothetical protein